MHGQMHHLCRVENFGMNVNMHFGQFGLEAREHFLHMPTRAEQIGTIGDADHHEHGGFSIEMTLTDDRLMPGNDLGNGAEG